MGRAPANKARQMKVFGLATTLRHIPHKGQVNAVVAAPSMKAAADALDTSTHNLRTYGRVTGNDQEVAAAMTEPGTVFWHPLDDRAAGFQAAPTQKRD